MYDILLRNATIIDGTGAARTSGSVASKNGKLAVLPADFNGDAKRVIDCSGLFVSPGFIDPHSHGDLSLGSSYASLSKISQGITTHVTGNCGHTGFPVNPSNLHLLKEVLAALSSELPEEMVSFTTYENYLSYVKKLAFPENVKILAGHIAIRIAVMGFEDRKPTPAELEKMKSMLREALEHGAGGFSSGLIYIPGTYADTEELVELAKVTAEYGGLYMTHIRNEGNDVCKAVDEAIETARRSGVKLVISHFKVTGKANWGRSAETLKKVDQANAEGLDVSCDQYPYTAGMSHLYICIPPKYFTRGVSAMIEYLKAPESRAQIKREIMETGNAFESWVVNCGGFDGILVTQAPKTPEVQGRRIGEYAAEIGKDPADVLFDILIANNGIASAIYFSMSDEDLCKIIQNPHVVVGTDGIQKPKGERTHPRTFGTFPHAIDYFVKEKHILTLEEMICKMTSKTAEATLIKNKGIIRDGYDSDLVVFNYEMIKGTADYLESNLLADGIEYVIVGGEVVYQDKKLTGANPGKVL